MQDALFVGTDVAQTPQPDQPHRQPVEELRQGKPRLRLADQSQVGMHLCSIDELVPVDHQVEVIWDAVCQMDLSAFVEPIRAREFTEGRPTTREEIDAAAEDVTVSICPCPSRRQTEMNRIVSLRERATANRWRLYEDQ